MKKPIRPIQQVQGKQAQGKRVLSGQAKRKKETQWEYFDDCFVCQAVKKSEEEGRSLGVEELKEVFEEANRKKSLS